MTFAVLGFPRAFICSLRICDLAPVFHLGRWKKGEVFGGKGGPPGGGYSSASASHTNLEPLAPFLQIKSPFADPPATFFPFSPSFQQEPKSITLDVKFFLPTPFPPFFPPFSLSLSFLFFFSPLPSL